MSVLFDIFATIYSLIGVPGQFDLKSIRSEVFHKRLLSKEARCDVTPDVVAQYIQYRRLQREATQRRNYFSC